MHGIFSTQQRVKQCMSDFIRYLEFTFHFAHVHNDLSPGYPSLWSTTRGFSSAANASPLVVDHREEYLSVSGARNY